MSQDASERKRQYLGIGIIISAVVSAVAILIAATQELEENFIMDTNSLPQESSSSTPTEPTSRSLEPNEGMGQSAPEISVFPATSTPKNQIAVEGTGFEPNEEVLVVIENVVLETTPQVLVADPTGHFSAAATVPVLRPGQYEVIASGEAGSLAAETMTIA